MNCPECEGAIFVYRELSAVEKQRVDEHVATCASCQKLFNEVESVNLLVTKASQLEKRPANAANLTNKILQEVSRHESGSGAVISPALWLTSVSIARYSLAAVSVGMILLFFVEVFAPADKSLPIKGPISQLQSAVLNSDAFRKTFSIRKERRRSLLTDCTSPLSRQTDQVCLKEKLRKLNF